MSAFATEREANIYQAMVCLQQARATRHRGWAFTLIEWAGNRRRAAMVTTPAEIVPTHGQLDLFA